MANGLVHFEPITNGISSHKDHKSRGKTKVVTNHVDITNEVSEAVKRIKLDIDRLTNKVNILESAAKSNAAMKRKPKLFSEISPQLLSFIIIWPLLATFIMQRFLYRK